MKKLLLLILLSLGFVNFSFAEIGVWGLNDLEIVSREEWGADESLRYWDLPEYQEFLKNRENYELYLQDLKDHDPAKYVKLKEKEDIENKRDLYIEENFPDEQKVNHYEDSYNGNKLWWTVGIKHNKNKIILHHTASDTSSYNSPNDYKQYLRNVYRYHAIKRGWGDVGYNFLIDEFGTIYEGRAGGMGTIGAHSSYNNSPSIGVTMIGNFQEKKPTVKQLESTIKLIVELSRKYNINPNESVTYHKESSRDPYIKDVHGHALAGHRDTGWTSCPGETVYELMPYIRKIVSEQLSKKTVLVKKTIKKGEKKVKVNKKFIVYGDQKTVSFKYDMKDFQNKCYVKTNSFELLNCSYEGGKLYFDVKYRSFKASGYNKLYVQGKDRLYSFRTPIIWFNDLSGFVELRKGAYEDKYGLTKAKYFSNKVDYKVSLDEAKKYLDGKVRVLLYDLSMDYFKWDLNCDKGCSTKVGGINFEGLKYVGVVNKGSDLEVFINGSAFRTDKLVLENNGGEISVSNYNRKSYAGIPWNTFRGNIEIINDKIKPIGKNIENKFIVVNELNFDDYMKGIAEMNDQQHPEKIKLMALIIKDYVLFYFNKKNVHPSIPADADYNAVDDPRIFQKYVGSGYERTAKKWFEGLNQTDNQIILWDGHIPILPYFNCSAGFTMSGKDRFGWEDTPYLQSKFDFVKCDKFNGHGVGLSGNGADYLAQRGLGYRDILDYYYGMRISELN